MKPIYIQHLLSVLLEEFEDLDYMLESLPKASRRDKAKIQNLLSQLYDQNGRLLQRFELDSKMATLEPKVLKLYILLSP